MKNLLFISVIPFPLDMGSKQHAYFLLKALVEQFNVYCIFFKSEKNQVPLNAKNELMKLGVKDYTFCNFEMGPPENKYIKTFKDLVTFPNSFMKSATHSKGLSAVRRFIDTYGIDIVHFEHFWFTKYSFDIHPSIKKVIVYHDLHHKVFKQFAKIERKAVRKMLHLAESFKFYIFEHLLEKQVSMKVFLNPIEMQSLPTNSVHIPHVVNSDISYKPVKDKRSFNILFLGSYNHQPNRTSFQYIVNDICPKMNAAAKNIEIHVFGSSTENFAPLLKNSPHADLFTIHGFANDINHAFEDMDLALFPILNGGGIKTKIIDALASGLPVVTTPEGIEGLHDLPDNCIGVGETPQEMADEIDRLLGDLELRSDRSRIGRQYVEKEFSFPAFSKKVQKNYLELTKKS